MMTWDPPQYLEINMNAEIGAYQDDFEERNLAPAQQLRQPPCEAPLSEA